MLPKQQIAIGQFRFYPACTCASRGYVIGVGVYVYYAYVTPKKHLNGTLAVDSPF